MDFKQTQKQHILDGDNPGIIHMQPCFNSCFAYPIYSPPLNLFQSPETLFSQFCSAPAFCWISVAHFFSFICVVLLCVFMFWVLCCDVRYNFHVKTMFDSSLPPVVCRRAHVLFTLFAICVCLRIVVFNTYCTCCIFILFFFV